jgi:CP family cyanate transporter-like MFS transporter
MRTQRPLILVVGASYVVGVGGRLLSPGPGTRIWGCAFGLGQGSGFALALTLIVLRSASPLMAARLGGVAQCLGYLLAAAGPSVLGALRDLTGGWSWPMGLLLALLVPMTWTGWGAARNAVLTEDQAPVSGRDAASPADARTRAGSAAPAAPEHR